MPHYIKIIVGEKGCGKVARMTEEFRKTNCRKYRLAIAGINWKEKKDLWGKFS